MSIPREEHDAKIDALEARVDGRYGVLIQISQLMREDMRETRLDVRQQIRSTIATGVAIIIAVVATGVGVHQANLSTLGTVTTLALGMSAQPRADVASQAVSDDQE